jgi:phenylacetate-coenzyme A ligase PaaK-like adenylate-forming protein
MRYNLGRDFWQNEPKLEGPRLAADVRQHIKAMVGVSCDVVLKAPGEVPRSQGKAVRVKDLRQANKP